MKKLYTSIIILVLCISVLAVFSFSGCAGTAAETTSEEVAGEVKTFTIWDFQAGSVYDNVFSELIPAFEEKYPNIKIIVVLKFV